MAALLYTTTINVSLIDSKVANSDLFWLPTRYWTLPFVATIESIWEIPFSILCWMMSVVVVVLKWRNDDPNPLNHWL